MKPVEQMTDELEVEIKAITKNQRLDAFSMKYYQRFTWKPRKGDYYCIARNDDLVARIVNECDEYFYTKSNMQNEECEADRWEKEKFLEDFGIYRVYLHPAILKQLE